VNQGIGEIARVNTLEPTSTPTKLHKFGSRPFSKKICEMQSFFLVFIDNPVQF
jgi:hypothetical protein